MPHWKLVWSTLFSNLSQLERLEIYHRIMRLFAPSSPLNI
jgi:hypothetical protein